MSTILDVERLSGVSKSTISRYLNGKSVRGDNRRRIEEAIRELGYCPNPLASGLKTKRTHVIGVVLPDITDAFFPPIVKHLERSLREHGYQTLINNYGNDSQLEKQQVEMLINQRVDGLIVASSATTGEHIRDCLQKGIPVVLLDRLLEDVECDSVTVDNYQATFDAVSMAIRRGHRKIGLIRGQAHVYTDLIRYKGYEDALRYHKIPLDPQYVVHADLVEHDAKRQFMRLMSLDDPPTLIFCSNVYMAAGALEARLEYSLDIPDEISVMTFDRLAAFPYYSFISSIQPEFTSICQPIEKVGQEAARLLLHRIQIGLDAAPPIHWELKTSFFMTDSVKDLSRKSQRRSAVGQKIF